MLLYRRFRSTCYTVCPRVEQCTPSHCRAVQSRRAASATPNNMGRGSRGVGRSPLTATSLRDPWDGRRLAYDPPRCYKNAHPELPVSATERFDEPRPAGQSGGKRAARCKTSGNPCAASFPGGLRPPDPLAGPPAAKHQAKYPCLFYEAMMFGPYCRGGSGGRRAPWVRRGAGGSEGRSPPDNHWRIP